MPITFDCPFCTYCKDVPDSFSGKKIKCPRCLATLTLGIPQPTALTALPLPEDVEETPLSMAIELDKRDALNDCPICFQLVDEEDEEKKCPMYCKYFEHDSNTGLPTGEVILEAYKDTKEAAKTNFYLGVMALFYGIAFIVGPFVIYRGRKLLPELCDNLGTESRKQINASIIMASAGILASIILVAGILGVIA